MERIRGRDQASVNAVTAHKWHARYLFERSAVRSLIDAMRLL